MKTLTKLSIPALIIFGFTGTSSAQENIFASLNKGNDSKFSYTKPNSDIPIRNNMNYEKNSSSYKYMHSEQFVFDNLASLKESFSVPDIYYDLDQAVIRTDARVILDKLVSLMREQEDISVAITAHCDSRMSKYNENLAVNRAKAANAYLVSKGIAADRVILEKHGRPSVKNPCDTNPGCSVAEQQLNRRAEFNIIFNGKNLGRISTFND